MAICETCQAKLYFDWAIKFVECDKAQGYRVGDKWYLFYVKDFKTGRWRRI
jgi:hypothetical protein